MSPLNHEVAGGCPRGPSMSPWLQDDAMYIGQGEEHHSKRYSRKLLGHSLGPPVVPFYRFSRGGFPTKRYRTGTDPHRFPSLPRFSNDFTSTATQHVEQHALALPMLTPCPRPEGHFCFCRISIQLASRCILRSRSARPASNECAKIYAVLECLMGSSGAASLRPVHVESI